MNIFKIMYTQSRTLSNTILVDNLYTNVIHFINQKNSVLINSFDTLDEKDISLRDVRKICQCIVRDLSEHPAVEDNVFSEHRIKRMGLGAYFNMFQTKQNVQMMNIGNTTETETFGTLKNNKKQKIRSRSTDQTQKKDERKGKTTQNSIII